MNQENFRFRALKHHLLATVAVALSAITQVGQANTNVTFTFKDGTDPDGAGTMYSGAYNGTADNRLVDVTEVNHNYGSNDFMGAGFLSGYIDRAILRFDLSGLGNNAATSPGTLTLHISSTPSGSGTIEAFAITSTDSWGEGTDNGNHVPSAGWSTWNDRAYPSTAWTGGPGLGTPGGGSYGLTTLDTFAWTSSSSGNFSLTIPQSVLQGWISNPSGNNGLLLRDADESSAGTRFFVSTREDSTAANHPQLVFSMDIPEPTTILLFLLTGLLTLLKRRQ